MDFFSILTMLGGLALFLYGMNAMGDGLAKVSGGKLERISGEADLKSHQGGTSRMWSYGSDPESRPPQRQLWSSDLSIPEL